MCSHHCAIPAPLHVIFYLVFDGIIVEPFGLLICFSFSQFDLVCSKSIYGTLAIASVFVGFFLGAIIIGPFTDKFGRKPTIFISGFVIALFSLVSAFPKVFWLFVVFKIFVGLGVGKRIFVKYCCQCSLLFVNS